jgi:anaphase-promoting complex subunit 3
LKEAIYNFRKSEALDSSNLVSRFQKAKCIALSGDFDAAIQDLQELQRQAPAESSIYILLGKLLHKTGRTSEAIQYLTWAMDLDPKQSNVVRDLIEKNVSADDSVFEIEL